MRTTEARQKCCAWDENGESPALDGCAVRRLSTPQTIVGVDVGEDYLDIAILRVKSLGLKHQRIGLCGIAEDSLRMVRERLAACCPDANSRWLALIDSPRWPLDLDCSSRGVLARDPVPAGRILDRALREMLRSSAARAAIQLSMFPTPRFEYFQECAKAPGCKPHLRSIYNQLFENGAARPTGAAVKAPARIAGGNFTRFMLAGFLTFRAWQDLGVETLEAYPNLQYRLSSARHMPAKREGKAAVAERIAITRLLRQSLGIGLSEPARTLDQADAEVLALSAAIAAKQGKLAALEHPAEGRFLITF